MNTRRSTGERRANTWHWRCGWCGFWAEGFTRQEDGQALLVAHNAHCEPAQNGPLLAEVAAIKRNGPIPDHDTPVFELDGERWIALSAVELMMFRQMAPHLIKEIGGEFCGPQDMVRRMS